MLASWFALENLNALDATLLTPTRSWWCVLPFLPVHSGKFLLLHSKLSVGNSNALFILRIDFSWSIPAGSWCYAFGFLLRSWDIQHALSATLLTPTRPSGYALNAFLELQHSLDSTFLAWSCYTLNSPLGIPTLTAFQHALDATLLALLLPPKRPSCYALNFLLERQLSVMLRFEPSLETVQQTLDATLHHGLDSTVLASSWAFQTPNIAPDSTLLTFSWNIPTFSCC